MKFAVGLLIAFLLGVGASYFDVPVPAPPEIKGSLLILAVTFGFIAGDRYLEKDDETPDAKASAQVTEEASPEPASE